MIVVVRSFTKAKKTSERSLEAMRCCCGMTSRMSQLPRHWNTFACSFSLLLDASNTTVCRRQLPASLLKPNSTTLAGSKLVMAALCNRCGHYIFALRFLSSFFFFFPRLISAVGDWMSTILPHIWCGLSVNLECMSEMCWTRLAENTVRKNVAKHRHQGTIAQL